MDDKAELGRLITRNCKKHTDIAKRIALCDYIQHLTGRDAGILSVAYSAPNVIFFPLIYLCGGLHVLIYIY